MDAYGTGEQTLHLMKGYYCLDELFILLISEINCPVIETTGCLYANCGHNYTNHEQRLFLSLKKIIDRYCFSAQL